MNQHIPTITQSIADTLGSIKYILPEISLTLLFLLMIGLDLFCNKRHKHLLAIVGLIGMAFVFSGTLDQLLLVHQEKPQTLFMGMVQLSRFGIWFKLLIDASIIVVILISIRDFQLRNTEKGNAVYYCLLISTAIGLHFMTMAVNLLMIYLAIEFVSVSSYTLAAYLCEKRQSEEAGMKYALFGAVASALMLYGMSLLYGFTGTLDLFDPMFYQGLTTISPLAAGAAILLTTAGLLFKISAFPMHVWTPDVYEGAPTPVAAFFSVAPKAAGIAVFIHLLTVLRPIHIINSTFSIAVEQIITIIAVVTMIAGNFAALWQSNIKRMLAYSSIGNSGFLLMSLAAYSLTGEQALLFFLIVYAVSNLGVFAVVIYFSDIIHSESVEDYKGLGMKHPIISGCMMVFLISLIGLPPTAGFVGKFLIFSATAEAYLLFEHPWLLALLIVGVITSIVSLFYYFKIPLNLYLRKAQTEISLDKGNRTLRLLIILLAAITLLLGVFPQILMRWMNF